MSVPKTAHDMAAFDAKLKKIVEMKPSKQERKS